MPVLDFDRNLFLALNSLHHPWINPLMVFVSSSYPWVLVAGAFTYSLAKRYPKRDVGVIVLMALMLMAMNSTMTSYFFKNMFHRLRPCKVDELRVLIHQFGQGCGGRWGFFSEHASNSSALMTFMLAFFPKRAWVHVLGWMAVALIGYSRIYVGVHFPLDVIAGIIWGYLMARGWIFIAKSSLKAPVAL